MFQRLYLYRMQQLEVAVVINDNRSASSPEEHSRHRDEMNAHGQSSKKSTGATDCSLFVGRHEFFRKQGDLPPDPASFRKGSFYANRSGGNYDGSRYHRIGVASAHATSKYPCVPLAVLDASNSSPRMNGNPKTYMVWITRAHRPSPARLFCPQHLIPYLFPRGTCSKAK